MNMLEYYEQMEKSGMDLDPMAQYEHMQMAELGTRGYLSNTHPTIEILYNNETINIDVDIVDLMKQIWSHGIKTAACCQGDEYINPLDPIANYAYISFNSHENILKFSKKYLLASQIGLFDILNPNPINKPLLEARYENIIDHCHRNGDLYSVRFTKDLIQLLLNN